jgi:hypothetical protein
MARLCRIFSAAILVVHLIVGCCAHHAHACDGQGHLPLAPAAGMPDDPCPTGHSHHGPQDCQGGTCSFVLPIRMVRSSIRTLQAPVAQFYDGPCFFAGTSLGQRCFAVNRPLSKVSLYLVNQVLLI